MWLYKCMCTAWCICIAWLKPDILNPNPYNPPQMSYENLKTSLIWFIKFTFSHYIDPRPSQKTKYKYPSRIIHSTTITTSQPTTMLDFGNSLVLDHSVKSPYVNEILKHTICNCSAGHLESRQRAMSSLDTSTPIIM